MLHMRGGLGMGGWLQTPELGMAVSDRLRQPPPPGSQALLQANSIRRVIWINLFLITTELKWQNHHPKAEMSDGQCFVRTCLSMGSWARRAMTHREASQPAMESQRPTRPRTWPRAICKSLEQATTKRWKGTGNKVCWWLWVVGRESQPKSPPTPGFEDISNLENKERLYKWWLLGSRGSAMS